MEVITATLAALAFFFTFGEIQVTQQQLQLDRDTQQRERFADAVGQLGDANQTVQTAGILAMEAIARADPSYREILDGTLTAYLRTTAPCDPPRGFPCPVREPGSAPALQAAVGVIGRADGPDPRYLDLRRTNLSQLDLRGANLAGAQLEGSNMSFTDVTGADLRSADMTLAIQEGIIGVGSTTEDDATQWP